MFFRYKTSIYILKTFYITFLLKIHLPSPTKVVIYHPFFTENKKISNSTVLIFFRYITWNHIWRTFHVRFTPEIYHPFPPQIRRRSLNISIIHIFEYITSSSLLIFLNAEWLNHSTSSISKIPFFDFSVLLSMIRAL